MGKPVLRVFGRYPSKGRIQGGPQRLRGPSGGGAQVRFELAEGQFNRDEVRRVRWQIQQAGSARFNQRGTATLQRLWRALPPRSRRHTRCFTDAWRAYPKVRPATAHVVGKTGTRVVEALNGELRHRCGVLVRRSRSFSNCRTSHYSIIKIALDQHIAESTLE